MKQIPVFLLMLLMHGVISASSIIGMKVDYLTEPIGLDNPQPVFGWQMNSDRKGAKQESFRIIVTDENGFEYWKSGSVKSSLSQGIIYNGKPLKPRTRYIWHVIANDEQNKTLQSASSFETGLMTENVNDIEWHNAKWIGGDKHYMPFEPMYLPVFRINYDVMLEESSKSQMASFIYGANDPRLNAGSNIRIELDISPLNNAERANVNIYRSGYSQSDNSNVPLVSFIVPDSLLNVSNRYASHSIEIVSSCGTTYINFNGIGIGEVNLNPIGKGGDYNAYPVLGDIGFSVPKYNHAVFDNISVKNYRHPYNCLAIIPTTELSDTTEIIQLEKIGLTMLRTDFQISKSIKKARLYMTARGVYDFYINGKRVTESYFNPGCSQYNKTQYYQSYDVTSLINKGGNAMGAVLGEGWWSGAISFTPENWNYWGDRQSLYGTLIVTYSDGSEEAIATNPDTWKVSNQGPYRYGSIFQGEIYDARRELEMGNWFKYNFDSESWKPSSEVSLEETISHEPALKGFITWPTADNYKDFKLKSQICPPVSANRILNSVSYFKRGKNYIYDMGQNMAGVPLITFQNLTPGTIVKIRYAEMLYPYQDKYGDKQGGMMLENLRAATVQDIYIAKGGTEIYQPRFTYHGYRYLEIEGLDNPLRTEEVKSVVLSTIDEFATDFVTDNQLLNQFIENVKWSSLANVFSIPTDCPQRNERMGWSGDLSVFCPSLSYIFNGTNFYRKHLNALDDCITEEGAYPAIAPIGGGFGGPIWESVGIILPWQNYLQYGDLETLKKYYPTMKKYMNHVLNSYIDHNDGHYKAHNLWSDLGDWLGFEVNKNDNTLIFDCYLVYELNLISKMASALHLNDDVKYWENKSAYRRNYIRTNYFDKDGQTIGCGFGPNKISPTGLIGSKPLGELIDTQTSYALPIAFDILEDSIKSKVVDNLVNSVQRKSIADDGTIYPSYSLMTGFIGTAWIMHALSNSEHSDVAYKLLLNESFPSWLYPVTQGATSIWERLNSYTVTDGFGNNNSMNSFNHYAFGSVIDWLCKCSAGIAPDEKQPGFKHFMLSPHPDFLGELKNVECNYKSLYGDIKSAWKIEGNNIIYEFSIPANTSATLILPNENPQEIQAGKYHFKRLI